MLQPRLRQPSHLPLRLLPNLSGTTGDNVSTVSTDGSSLTISHTTSGSDRLMLVGVFCTGEAPALLEKVMAKLIGQVLRPNKTTLTATPMPSELPIGKDNVMITFSANLQRYAVAEVITFTGVNQTTPLSSGSSFAAVWEFASFAGKLQTPSTLPNLTIPSSSRDLVFGVFGCKTCTSVTLTIG